MYNYSDQIIAFRFERVRLSTDFLGKLVAHRDANRQRLIGRIAEHMPKVSLSDSNFKPQGSVVVRLIIQTKFPEEEYDVDDGIVMWKHQLVDKDGNELSAEEVREKVCAALQDDRFAKPPEVHHNCVRVFYRTSDEERHHVDFAVYRKYYVGEEIVRELAGAEGWAPSDPTQVNSWVDDLVRERNSQQDGWGTQFRRFVQLMKRFARSRREWDLPNGMKLMMLVAECQPPFKERIDVAFRELLQAIKSRLSWNRVIRNLAHPDAPALTRSASDQNVVALEEKVGEALTELARLDRWNADNADDARAVWDWLFQSDGFFADLDARKKEEARQAALVAKASLIGLGARTSSLGVIGSAGIANVPHHFYGGERKD